MKRVNKRRVVLIAGIVILLCMSIIAGVTYALFQDQEVIKDNHLIAGELDITLKRTKLTTTYLDPDTGYLADKTDDVDKDFTNDTNENVFDIDTSVDFIAPGCAYSAEMELTNNSDVAFHYWIEIKLSDDADPDLAEQLEIVVTPEGQAPIKLAQGVLVYGDNTDPVGTLAKLESGKFTVTVTFLDDVVHTQYDNDDAQGKEVKFDLYVYAEQATKAPTP